MVRAYTTALFVALSTSSGAIAQGALSAADLSFVCRGAIATVMGREISGISEYRREDGISYVQYRRPSDQTRWRNRCRVEQNRVIWSTVDVDGPGSGPGRWRDSRFDEVLRFELSGDELRIRQFFSDGSGTNEVFHRN